MHRHHYSLNTILVLCRAQEILEGSQYVRAGAACTDINMRPVVIGSPNAARYSLDGVLCTAASVLRDENEFANEPECECDETALDGAQRAVAEQLEQHSTYDPAASPAENLEEWNDSGDSDKNSALALIRQARWRTIDTLANQLKGLQI